MGHIGLIGASIVESSRLTFPATNMEPHERGPAQKNH